jgi:hypothetical protein
VDLRQLRATSTANGLEGQLIDLRLAMEGAAEPTRIERPLTNPFGNSSHFATGRPVHSRVRVERFLDGS